MKERDYFQTIALHNTCGMSLLSIIGGKVTYVLKVLICLEGNRTELVRNQYLVFSSLNVYGIVSLFSILYEFLHFLGKAIDTKYLFMAKYVQGTGAIKKLLINGPSRSL